MEPRTGTRLSLSVVLAATGRSRAVAAPRVELDCPVCYSPHHSLLLTTSQLRSFNYLLVSVGIVLTLRDEASRRKPAPDGCWM